MILGYCPTCGTQCGARAPGSTDPICGACGWTPDAPPAVVFEQLEPAPEIGLEPAAAAPPAPSPQKNMAEISPGVFADAEEE